MKRAVTALGTVLALPLVCVGLVQAQVYEGYLDVLTCKVKPEKRTDFDVVAKKMADANRRYKGDTFLASQVEYGEQNTLIFTSGRENYAAIDKGMAASSDKRTWQRFAANVTASVQLTNSSDLTHWPAKVLNLSPGGVALVVERDIRNGTLLTANLCGATGQTVETILICVVHITTLDDGTRRLGCNFIRELEESHLRQLLA